MTDLISFPWSWLWRLLAVIAGLWLVVNTWQLWLLLLTALILAAAMLPAARWGERRRIPRIVTVGAIYLGAAVLLFLLGRFLVPALLEQGGQFARQLPAIVANVKGWLGNLSQLGGDWAILLPGAQSWEKIGPGLVENTLRATAGVVGGLLGLLVILILAAYVVVDAPRISRGLLALVSPEARPKVAALAEPVLRRMGGYVRGQIVVSSCVGIILALGLWLLGVPYALLIGGLAAALNVIPFLGSILAAVLGILAALNLSLPLALWTTLLFWGTNVIEGKLLVPQLVGRATGLHPLAVMLVLLAGAKLGGLVGALVAVPLLAGGWEIVRALWVAPLNAVEAAGDRA
jgi:predicted PurR-regulated permease PerM